MFFAPVAVATVGTMLLLRTVVRSARRCAIGKSQASEGMPPVTEARGHPARRNVAVCRVASTEGTSRLTVWQKAASATPPEPASAGAERLGEHIVRVEHFNGGTSPRVNVVKRLLRGASIHMGRRNPIHGRPHAAAALGSASAKRSRFITPPRCYSAAVFASGRIPLRRCAELQRFRDPTPHLGQGAPLRAKKAPFENI